MKGIILAGGLGTRLYPSSTAANKQLLPIFDKPMIYYPLSTLMFAGIKDVLVISTPQDISRFESVLGDGTKIGIKISYAVQEKPEGIAQSFIIGEQFIGQESVCLILGDNIFFGEGMARILKRAGQLKEGALVFGYWVKDSERFGVVDFDKLGKVLGLEEKPLNPKSHYAVPGLYFYDYLVVETAKSLKPSARGELEITDVNKEYLKSGKLRVEIIKKGVAWLDTGTPESLLEAANYISIMEKRHGIKIGCIEEVALNMGFIKRNKLAKLIGDLPVSAYSEYLRLILKRG